MGLAPSLSTRQIGVVFLSVFLLTACSSGPKVAAEPPENFPHLIADPAEPFNRGVNNVNQGLLTGVVHPASRVYRAITPSVARRSVTNFSKNIGYPGRLLNNVFQGRWQGAGSETLRFLTNTTVGVGGLFDPATRWKIPESKATFSQTFFKWGWRPKNFVMLPVFGPSDELHVTERVGDQALRPWFYYPRLAPVGGLITLNQLSGQADTILRFSKSEGDPYETTKFFWTYSSREWQPNWTVNAPKHSPTLQTLNVVTHKLKDSQFPFKGKQGKVRLSSTGRKISFNYWLQKKRAPLVFIAPGLGSHSLSNLGLIIAENLYHQGYSVVSTSSVFHPEFIENASTAAVPGYSSVDSRDLLVTLAETNQYLEKKHPGRFGQRALVGYSLGGFHGLLIAAREADSDFGLLNFDRYVAINSPVSLLRGNKIFDEYINAPLQWPEEQRAAILDNTLHKAVLIPFAPKEITANLPLSGVESKYLVALSFRFSLRDAIYSSQRRVNLGVLQNPLNDWNRQSAYNEILGYSFDDYVNSFILPYYETRGVSLRDFKRESDLKNYGRALRANKKIRVMTNQDDFLLNSSDISWLKSNFRSRFTLFPNGGHLGNLDSAPVQEKLLEALSGLQPTPVPR